MLPPQVQSVITVYNLVEVNDGVQMYPTVLKYVYWDSTYGMTMRQQAVETKDRVRIIIPIDVKAEAERTYIDPFYYKLLCDTVRPKHWTLAKGDKVINQVVGDTFERPRDLEEALGISNVLTITEVSPNLFGSKHMQHYDVTGR